MSTCSWENEKVIIFLLRTVHGSLSRASRTDKQGRLREVELWIHMRLMCRLNMWEWCSLVVWWGTLRNTMKVFQSDCYTRECIERASYNTSVIFSQSFVWKDLNSTICHQMSQTWECTGWCQIQAAFPKGENILSWIYTTTSFLMTTAHTADSNVLWICL